MAIFTTSISASDVLAGLTTDSVKWKGGDIATILTDTANIQPTVATNLDDVLTTTVDGAKKQVFFEWTAGKHAFIATAGTWALAGHLNYDSGAYIANSTTDDADGFSCGSFYLSETTDLTATILYGRSNNRGIIELFMDGASEGTQDMYGGGEDNQSADIAIGSTTAGTHAIRLVINSKNGSSSDYACEFQSIMVRKT